MDLINITFNSSSKNNSNEIKYANLCNIQYQSGDLENIEVKIDFEVLLNYFTLIARKNGQNGSLQLFFMEILDIIKRKLDELNEVNNVIYKFICKQIRMERMLCNSSSSKNDLKDISKLKYSTKMLKMPTQTFKKPTIIRIETNIGRGLIEQSLAQSQYHNYFGITTRYKYGYKDRLSMLIERLFTNFDNYEGKVKRLSQNFKNLQQQVERFSEKVDVRKADYIQFYHKATETHQNICEKLAQVAENTINVVSDSCSVVDDQVQLTKDIEVATAKLSFGDPVLHTVINEKVPTTEHIEVSATRSSKIPLARRNYKCYSNNFRQNKKHYSRNNITTYRNQ